MRAAPRDFSRTLGRGHKPSRESEGIGNVDPAAAVRRSLGLSNHARAPSATGTRSRVGLPVSSPSEIASNEEGRGPASHPLAHDKEENLELIFILAFLSLAGSLVAALISALRGRRKKALWLATACAASSAIYMTVLMTVAVLSPQRVLAVGEDHCFDGWCIAVRGVTVAPQLGNVGEVGQGRGQVLRGDP